MLYIKGIGLSTAVLSNVETMADVLIEKNIYSIVKNSKKRDAVKEALEEAHAEEVMRLYVEEGACDLCQALSTVKEETAIICTQMGNDGCLDAAVIVVTPDKTEQALAILESSSLKETPDIARIREVYNEKGPVADALTIIEACVAKYYGFDLKRDWSGEIFLDEEYKRDIPISCNIANGTYSVSQGKGITKLSDKRLKYMLPVSFQNIGELGQKLDDVRKELQNEELREITKKYLRNYAKMASNMKVIVFLALNSKDLEKEIDAFCEQKEHWQEESFVWRTKSGSCYIATPAGKSAGVCYLNPPGGMFSKVQFYRLYRAFPQLRELLSENRIKQKSKDELITRYYFEIITIMLTVKALELIGVKQDSVIGGSLGELSIPLIFDVMSIDGEVMNAKDCSLDSMYSVIGILEELIDSQPELSKQYFGKEIEALEKWYLVCDYKIVQSEIDKFPNKSPIYMTIIGSPKDVVICGTNELCKKLIQNLHCYATQFRDPIYAHTPVLEATYDDLVEKVVKVNGRYREDIPFTIYNTYKCERMGNRVEDYARNFADCLIKQVDMPSIFRKAYDEGCRLFIDLGSSMFCSRWAKATFEDKKDAYVMSLYDQNIASDSVMSIISLLIANQMDFDFYNFMKWYYPETELVNKEEIIQFESIHNNKSNVETTQLLNEIAKLQLRNNEIVWDAYLKYENHLIRSILQEKKDIDITFRSKKEKDCLYNYDQILEMTEGSMAKVLGQKYQAVDQYAVRARMPLPPYLFVSRILKMNVTYGEFKEGSSIEAEYDVPFDSIMAVSKKMLASVVYSEAGHIGIFLAACMGIDEYSHGKTKFRITDVTTKYVSDLWPQPGDTVRMTFVIDKFIQNGDTTLLICTYRVYLHDELIIDAKETGGFFTQEVLDNGAGVVTGNLFASLPEKNLETSLYCPVTNRNKFTREEVHMFFRGEHTKCLGKNVVNSDMPYQVCEDAIFVDEILDMSSNGGKYGLGYIVASKEIEPSFWPFQCHFKNDPVLPGTIMLEGLSQVLTFFETCMGIFNTKNKFETRVRTGYPVQTKFRGEVKRAKHTLLYKVYPKEVKLVDGKVRFIADGEVYCDGLQVITQKNIGMMVVECLEM